LNAPPLPIVDELLVRVPEFKPAKTQAGNAKTAAA